ncbi:MAG: hypothetical protein LM577_07305 [Thermoproteaceae archaeon]|nr:hypothetical protein [Thermoproteaceae archaeon]
MLALERLAIALLLAVAAVAAGWLLVTGINAQLREFSRVYPVAAYVDSDGDFLICVLNAGPGDFYGRWVVSLASGRSVEIQLYAPVGKIVGIRGSLGEGFAPGTSPALVVVSGSGAGKYYLQPAVVPDISGVECG